MDRGSFITIEGGEGAGKSTQAALLGEAIGGAGIDVLVTREPGGAPGAEDIRTLLVEGSVSRWDPMSEALLHYAARKEHLETTVIPALDAGRWVISDRFADSTMAYQGYGHGLGSGIIARLHDLVLGDFRPDLTVILDVAVETGLERGNAGREDRYERMGTDFHRRLRQGFVEIARLDPERCALLDAGQSLEDTQAAIRRLMGDRLGLELE